MRGGTHKELADTALGGVENIHLGCDYTWKLDIGEELHMARSHKRDTHREKVGG